MARDQFDLGFARGSDCNPVAVGGVTKLLGDPKKKPEKSHTTILFPGGAVEIARTSDNQYWVHVTIRDETEFGGAAAARIVRARMDHGGRYNDEGNAALQAAIAAQDCNHIAFLVAPAGVQEGAET